MFLNRKTHTVKMSVITNLIHRLNTIIMENIVSYSEDINMLILMYGETKDEE